MLRRTLVLRVDGTREYRDVDVPEEVEETEDVQAAPYTETELIQQEITDLQLADIEQGQEITELFLTQLGG